MTKSLSNLFERDLEKLDTEIKSFRREENIWKTVNGIINPCGNLSLHICGNLQHFIGATLGSTGYKRDRDREFAARDISISKLRKEINETSGVVSKTLLKLNSETLNDHYPIDFLQSKASTEQVLLHLYGHMQWHLGHINYLRRILES